MEEDIEAEIQDYLRAVHEEETEIVSGAGDTAYHKEDFERAIPQGFLGSVSAWHDGTWAFERRHLQRRLEQAAHQEKAHLHFSVWNRPRGPRGLYLDIRSRLWLWRRLIRGLGNASRWLDHDR